MRLPFIPTSETSEQETGEHDYQLPLDLNRLLIDRPASTFLLCSDAKRHGVHPGDILVVDRSQRPRHSQLIIGVEEGELQLMLHPAAEVWGAVIYVIHKT